MLKKHMAAGLLATAFAAAPAFAQTSTAPPPSGSTDRPAATGTGSPIMGSSAMQPGTGAATQPGAGSSSAAGGAQGQFVVQMQPNQMMASSLIGTTVVSSNNESIGDVNDVIVDRSGQAVAVVIGVGGFLGIGEKDVAVPFQSLDFQAPPQTMSGTGAPGSANAPATTGSTSATQQNTATATTGNTGSIASADRDGGVPDRVVLKMTKAELQAAPAFQTASRNASGAGSSGGTGGSGTPTAPRQ